MDEDFEYFLEKLGPAYERRYASSASLERYKGQLPDQLLKYWDEYGWCGYGKGLFWTVDPEEYEPALEAWIGNTELMSRDAFHVIARSAFGKLYLWGPRTGAGLMIDAVYGQAFIRTSPLVGDKADRGIQSFFAGQQKTKLDQLDAEESPLFDAALARLGTLAHDEMYGFVPALALGGPARLQNLQKVKAVEHLVLLAQLAQLQVFEAPRR